MRQRQLSYEEIFSTIVLDDDDCEDEPSLITAELNAAIVLIGYKNGFFPWFQENELFFWFSPNPRCVLLPDELHISKSMQKTIRQNKFEFRYNTSCEAVMNHCATITRKPVVYQGEIFANDGTWLDEHFKKTYMILHQLGYVVSLEAWQNNQLVGGLYGVKIGNVFFGESMFAIETNASKFAFIQGVQYLQSQGIEMMDCQQKSSHVMSLGARTISRSKFIAQVKSLTKAIKSNK